MPIKRAKRVYRKRRGARRARRAGIPRSPNPRYQVATVVETFDPQVSFQDNTAVNQTISLGMFKRCKLMARLYEQFRIEEVKYTYTPLFNTFAEGPGGTSPSVPSFYFAMDRLNSLIATTTTLTDLVQMGATRNKFIKPFIVKYRPNTMITTGVSQPLVSTETLQINGADYGRWFPCVTQTGGSANNNTPNTLSAFNQLYYGHWVYIEQLLNPGVQSASVAIQVRVSFKNPLINENPTPNEDVEYFYNPPCGPTQTPSLRVIGAAD